MVAFTKALAGAERKALHTRIVELEMTLGRYATMLQLAGSKAAHDQSEMAMLKAHGEGWRVLAENMRSTLVDLADASGVAIDPSMRISYLSEEPQGDESAIADKTEVREDAPETIEGESVRILKGLIDMLDMGVNFSAPAGVVQAFTETVQRAREIVNGDPGDTDDEAGGAAAPTAE